MIVQYVRTHSVLVQWYDYEGGRGQGCVPPAVVSLPPVHQCSARVRQLQHVGTTRATAGTARAL
jgi:hypothetical protein